MKAATKHPQLVSATTLNKIARTIGSTLGSVAAKVNSAGEAVAPKRVRSAKRRRKTASAGARRKSARPRARAKARRRGR